MLTQHVSTCMHQFILMCLICLTTYSYSLHRPLCLDVNDNVPFFMSSTYEATVPEGAEIGTSVAQVSATDLDSGLHGMVRPTYHLFI